jgi:hypothetical protein
MVMYNVEVESGQMMGELYSWSDESGRLQEVGRSNRKESRGAGFNAGFSSSSLLSSPFGWKPNFQLPPTPPSQSTSTTQLFLPGPPTFVLVRG